MEFNQVEWDKASDIVASEVGFKIDLNKRPRPSLFLYVRVLLSLGTRRGRECQAAGMAWGAPRNQKPDPNHQLISLWSYAVATKVENLKLAAR